MGTATLEALRDDQVPPDDEKLRQSAGALVTMSSAHYRIHAGQMWTMSHREVFGAAGDLDILFRVVANQAAHVAGRLSGLADATFTIWEAVTVSGDGTAVQRQNKNRFQRAHASTSLVFHSPTGFTPPSPGDPTEIDSGLLPGGAGFFSPGTEIGFANEWLLDPGDYIIRVSTAIGNTLDVGLDWYEPGNPVPVP